MKKPSWPLVAVVTTINGTIAFHHLHNDIESPRVVYPQHARHVTAPYSASYTNSIAVAYWVDGARWP